MQGSDIEKRDFAQTLARGLACLEALAGPMTGSEVAAAIGASRAAARRLLLTLESLGYVHEDHGRYATAPKVLALGRGLFGTRSVWSAAAPEVVALADRFNEPCSIAVLDGLEILFVCRDATRRIYTSRLAVGDRLPAHCSASGKMLLASLPEAERRVRLEGARLPPQGPASITDPAVLEAALARIRADGFALAVDEMEDGTLSIAVPLQERGGRTVAAISVASHRSRLSAHDLEAAVLPALSAAARRVDGVIRDFQDRGWAVL